mgnify:CR=1 FL=1
MKQVTRFDANFDMKSVVDVNTIESLDVYEEYMDYAIYRTCERNYEMMGKPYLVSEDEERRNAKIQLEAYFEQPINSGVTTLTRDNNIRYNAYAKGFYSDDPIKMNEAYVDGKDKVVDLLIKNAIERDAYEQNVMRKLNPQSEVEFICSQVTKKMHTGEYKELVDLIKTNKVYQKDLIDNYIDFKYRSNYKQAAVSAREIVPISSIALTNLEIGMQGTGQYSNKSTRGIYK